MITSSMGNHIKLFQFSLIFLLAFLSSLALSFDVLWLVPIVSLAYLFAFIDKLTRISQVFLSTFIFGFTYYFFGLSWMMDAFYSLIDGLSLNSKLLVLIFITLNALVFTLTITLIFKIFQNQCFWVKWIFIASSIPLNDVLRKLFFHDFHWMAFGYSQQNNFSLVGFTPVIGVEGTSFIMAFYAVLIFTFFKKQKFLKILAGLFGILGLAYFLGSINWTVKKKVEPALKVSLFQPKPIIETKYSYQEYKAFIKALSQQVGQVKKQQGTGENHWYLFGESTLRSINDPVYQALKKTHSDIWLISGFNTRMGLRKNINGILDIRNNRVLYAKNRLILVAEHTPRWLKPVIEKLNIPSSMQSLNRKPNPKVHFMNTPVSFFICYEVNHGDFWRQRMQNTDIAFVFSSMLWSPDSLGARQFLMIIKARARETGKPVVLISDTRFSGVILPNGQAKLIQDKSEDYITAQIIPYKGVTPYTFWGDYSYIIYWLIFFVALLLAFNKRKNSHIAN